MSTGHCAGYIAVKEPFVVFACSVLLPRLFTAPPVLVEIPMALPVIVDSETTTVVVLPRDSIPIV